jgi:hypothetical protein
MPRLPELERRRGGVLSAEGGGARKIEEDGDGGARRVERAARGKEVSVAVGERGAWS